MTKIRIRPPYDGPILRFLISPRAPGRHSRHFLPTFVAGVVRTRRRKTRFRLFCENSRVFSSRVSPVHVIENVQFYFIISPLATDPSHGPRGHRPAPPPAPPDAALGLPPPPIPAHGMSPRPRRLSRSIAPHGARNEGKCCRARARARARAHPGSAVRPTLIHRPASRTVLPRTSAHVGDNTIESAPPDAIPGSPRGIL